VYFGELSWRSLGRVGEDGIHAFENDTGPDDANHAHEGMYLIAGPGIEGGPGTERDIRDVTDDSLPDGAAGAIVDGGVGHSVGARRDARKLT
jgi:predicted AlkP superfamily phosphohydrolase/phosphomutase